MPLERRVWDVMDSHFTTVTPETPLKDACAILSSQNQKTQGGVQALVVMRASGEYIGLLTSKDIMKYLIHLFNKSKRENKTEEWLNALSDHRQDDSLVTVNDVMVFYEVTVRPIQKLGEALQLMDDHELDVLPVVDAGKVLGLISGVAILGEIARGIK
ncbi:MAG: CBS domain-containing protein [Thermodesulfobacteriota bacterium]